MSTTKKRAGFFETPEGREIEHLLREMATDSTYNTESSYTTNKIQYPDNLIPFVEKHKNYIVSHPALNPQHYISNLRLMTRLR